MFSIILTYLLALAPNACEPEPTPTAAPDELVQLACNAPLCITVKNGEAYTQICDSAAGPWVPGQPKTIGALECLPITPASACRWVCTPV